MKHSDHCIIKITLIFISVILSIFMLKSGNRKGAKILYYNIIQLLDETKQNIVIYQWRADQLFTDTEGRGK